jgi:chitin disaccharide deacetylase
MTKYLIVNADDYAMSPGVSRGILKAHAQGVVTSTTAMVNTADAPQSLSSAVSEAPALGLGLHVNLSFGRPVSSPAMIPSLVGADGCFFSGTRLVDALKRFRRDDVRREVQAQFRRFIEVVDRPPDHLDSHQHLAGLQPDVFAIVLELADAAGIPIRDPGDFLDRCRLRRLLHRIRKENGAGPLFEDFAELPAILHGLLQGQVLYRAPDAFRYEFYGSDARREILLGVLDSMPDGVTELMCHPGYADDLEDSYRQPRQRELAILCEPSLREAIRARGLELVSFAMVGRS